MKNTPTEATGMGAGALQGGDAYTASAEDELVAAAEAAAAAAPVFDDEVALPDGQSEQAGAAAAPGDAFHDHGGNAMGDDDDVLGGQDSFINQEAGDAIAETQLPLDHVEDPVTVFPEEGNHEQQLDMDAQHQQEAEDGDVPQTEEAGCQFCKWNEPGLTPEALDLHYWRYCPMLTECQHCQQVVEVSGLRQHLAEECDKWPGDAQAKLPNNGECPLCYVQLLPVDESGQCTTVPEDDHATWAHHLVKSEHHAGCPQNPRTNGTADGMEPETAAA